MLLGDIFGPDIFVALVAFVMGLATLVVPIWAIVDAATRPSGAFAAAGSSKAMWIAIIAVAWVLTGIIGLVLGVVYLANIRPRVRAITR
jgi:Protein of unknown function (DUF2516)